MRQNLFLSAFQLLYFSLMSTKGAISETKIIVSSMAGVENDPTDSFGTSYVSERPAALLSPPGHKVCENVQGWVFCDLKMQHKNLVF